MGATTVGYFNNANGELDDFLYQIQVEELPYRQGFQPEPDNELIELVLF